MSEENETFGLVDYAEVLETVSLPTLVASSKHAGLSLGLTKAKLSDAKLSSIPRERRRNRRPQVAVAVAVMASIALALAVVDSRRSSRRREPTAPAPGGAGGLRVASSLFRRATTKQIDGEAFVAATEALVPWLDRLAGLGSMVDVNVRKLDKRGVRGRQLDAVLAGERRNGLDSKDDSATVAALWNGRVLRFIAVFIDEILKSPDVSAVSPSAAARAAYEATLERHHTRLMRAAARTLLANMPDAAALFETKLGYDAADFNTTLRADFADLTHALTPLLYKLDHLLAANSGGLNSL